MGAGAPSHPSEPGHRAAAPAERRGPRAHRAAGPRVMMRLVALAAAALLCRASSRLDGGRLAPAPVWLRLRGGVAGGAAPVPFGIAGSAAASVVDVPPDGLARVLGAGGQLVLRSSPQGHAWAGILEVPGPSRVLLTGVPSSIATGEWLLCTASEGEVRTQTFAAKSAIDHAHPEERGHVVCSVGGPWSFEDCTFWAEWAGPSSPLCRAVSRHGASCTLFCASLCRIPCEACASPARAREHLRPLLPRAAGIMLLAGESETHLARCTLSGAGLNAQLAWTCISALQSARCSARDCTMQLSSDFGARFTMDARVTLQNCTFDACAYGLWVDERARVEAAECTFRRNDLGNLECGPDVQPRPPTRGLLAAPAGLTPRAACRPVSNDAHAAPRGAALRAGRRGGAGVAQLPPGGSRAVDWRDLRGRRGPSCGPVRGPAHRALGQRRAPW